MAPRQERGNAKTRFVEAYTKQFGDKPPKPYIDNCYDAIAVLALAVHHAKRSEPKAIRDAAQVANPPESRLSQVTFSAPLTSLVRARRSTIVGPRGGRF